MHDQLRAGIAAPPAHMANRPIHRGYPVPFFVAWIDGVPDFRVADTARFEECRRFERCWLCGKPLGAHRVFVIGPMCTVNRVSSEPPSHRSCAEYAATVCPHIVNPEAKRRAKTLPAKHRPPAGQMVRDNPGVVAVWESKTYQFFKASGGMLIDIGAPVQVDWWSRGRRADRATVMPAFEASVNRLKTLTTEHYDKHEDAEERIAAFLELGRQTGAAMKFLPVA